MTKIEIEFAHHHGSHVPGDRVKLDEDDARRLVQGGRANYVTADEAKKAEGDAGADKTARSRARG